MEAVVTLRILGDTTGESSSVRLQRRAFLSPDVLRTYKFTAGEWVQLQTEGAPKGGPALVQIWPRSGLEDDAIALSDVHRLNLPSDKVDVHRFDAGYPLRKLVKSVTLEPNGPSDVKARPHRELEWMRAAAKETLISLRFVSVHLQIFLVDETDTESVWTISGLEASTKTVGSNVNPADLARGVSNLNLSNGNTAPEVFQMDWRTKIIFAGDDSARDSGSVDKDGSRATKVPAAKTFDGKLPSYINLFTPSASLDPTSAYNFIGGLEPQIKLIRSMLDLPFLHPELYSLFGLAPPRGILLHGPPGTGKTALARAVASSNPDCSCIVVNGPELSSAFHGETEERLRGVFEEARKRSPCIVVLDEVDALCPRRDGDGGEVERRVVATLLTLLDGMGAAANAERVFVIAATNRPNSVDPALRRPGRFDREIEIGIPDAAGRRHIIEILIKKIPHSLFPTDITDLSARTHGFVGADLVSLIRESASAAIERWHAEPSVSRPAQPTLTVNDLLHILPSIRPSSMREVYIDTPSVKWSDIGGQDGVKQKLKECVEWPLTHRDTFTRLGVEAPKGVLLYGPPGCSKTMTAKALATESGLNFMAVKGPELLNKYVGESERAVREIFRKARAASPSIVFFVSIILRAIKKPPDGSIQDEIDALGSARSDDSAHSGVLTSLLNEMDGIEQLSGVIVVAATNRPDILDSALMRPGRLDRILYVGAPDIATRKAIFKIRFARMAIEPGVDVDELAQLTDGCSGAEVVSVCQDAALAAMNEDVNAPYVKHDHLLHSARSMRRRITPELIQFFEEWRDQSGVRSA